LNPILVLISANQEWRAVKEILGVEEVQSSALGEWFARQTAGVEVVFFHGGWGKIAAAASTQYVIDRWQPPLLINLGTCGGFAGDVQRGEVLLVERTVVYDILEQMGDAEQALAAYASELDLDWLGDDLPGEVRRAPMLSADRDLLAEDIPTLRAKHGAVAGDWESGAIAYVAARNRLPCLILRGVSDVVSEDGSPAYANLPEFERAAQAVMRGLLESLPAWLERWSNSLNHEIK